MRRLGVKFVGEGTMRPRDFRVPNHLC